MAMEVSGRTWSSPVRCRVFDPALATKWLLRGGVATSDGVSGDAAARRVAGPVPATTNWSLLARSEGVAFGQDDAEHDVGDDHHDQADAGHHEGGEHEDQANPYRVDADLVGDAAADAANPPVVARAFDADIDGHVNLSCDCGESAMIHLAVQRIPVADMLPGGC